MTIRIPEGERSKQLEYYHRVAKFKGDKRYPNYKYNGGNPRASLTTLPPFQKYLAARLYDKKSHCKRENIAYDLDVLWAAQQQPICAVTGVQLTLTPGPLFPNIDRIDPTKGYVKSNVRVVAHWFNQAKRDWSDAQIQDLIVAAGKHLTARR